MKPWSSSAALPAALAPSALPPFSWRRAVAPLVVSALVSGGLTLAHSRVASAAVAHAGTWPATEKPVSVDIQSATRAVALNELADAAGWSLVVRDSAPPTARIDLHVSKQPPSKVLDLILADVPGTYTATRDGNLISLSFAGSGTAATAPGVPAAPPPPDDSPMLAPPAAAPTLVDAGDLAKLGAAKTRGDDRTITGGSLRIEKNEVVHDVSVFGGNVDVYGTVTGSVTVLGGSAHLFPGAHVDGSSSIIGGSVRIDDGVVIDGDVGIVGGSVTRAPGAVIHGSVKGNIDGDDDDDDDADSAKDDKRERRSEAAEGAGFSVSGSALLFVLGALFLAFAPRRMDLLRDEVLARPLRALGVGALSTLGLCVMAFVLCCTIVGIPIALLVALGTPVVMMIGGCAILTTVGGGLLQHRTRNPNVHLAAGCVLFFLVGFIPVVGPLVRLAVALMGLGVMIATQGAGFVTKKSGTDDVPTTGAPYR